MWSIQFIVTISVRSSFVEENLIRLGKFTFKPPTWGSAPPHTSLILNSSYALLFSFSDPAAWLEYKAHSATMLTSTRGVQLMLGLK